MKRTAAILVCTVAGCRAPQVPSASSAPASAPTPGAAPTLRAEPPPDSITSRLFEEYRVALMAACFDVDCSAWILAQGGTVGPHGSSALMRVQALDLSPTADFPVRALVLAGVDRAAHVIAPQILEAAGRMGDAQRLRDLPRVTSVADVRRVQALLASGVDKRRAATVRDYEDAQCDLCNWEWVPRKPTRDEYLERSMEILSDGLTQALEALEPRRPSRGPDEGECDATCEEVKLRVALVGVVVAPLEKAAEGGFKGAENITVAVFLDLVDTARAYAALKP